MAIKIVRRLKLAFFLFDKIKKCAKISRIENRKKHLLSIRQASSQGNEGAERRARQQKYLIGNVAHFFSELFI
ncbi:hypothetical protein [Streptococcus sp. k-378]|uniref:hypothetical protein n=1 Tax=Streptococcus sp. k-378 TaxID=2582632 RepID=UPI001561D8D8|nr:hypothetical protein [Streptococcus sp. k-378]